MKEAILLAAYGGRETQERDSGLALLRKEITERTGMTTALAYYNRALLAQTPENAPEKQLRLLREISPEKLTVLPVFMTPGRTWTALRAQILAHRGDFAGLDVLPALLETEENRERLARLLPDVFCVEAGERCLLIGHGAADETDGLYLDLEQRLRAAGMRGVSFALLHGAPGVRDILWLWDAGESRTVVLIPFLFAAGRHLMTDIAGEGDCAASLLRAAGYRVDVRPRGLLDYPEVRRLLIAQLADKISI